MNIIGISVITAVTLISVYISKIFTETVNVELEITEKYVNRIYRFDPLVSDSDCLNPTCLNRRKCTYMQCRRDDGPNCEGEYLRSLRAANDECVDEVSTAKQHIDNLVILLLDGVRYDTVCKNESDDTLHSGALPSIHGLEKSLNYLKATHFKCIATPPTLTESMFEVIFEGIINSAAHLLVAALTFDKDRDNILCKIPGRKVAVGEMTIGKSYSNCLDEMEGGYYYVFNEDDPEVAISRYMDTHPAGALPPGLFHLHSLAIDSRSHRSADIDHPDMAWPYVLSDELIRKTILFAFGPPKEPRPNNDRTMVMILSDHGMTQNGVHGMDDEEATNAFLSLYTRDRMFHDAQPDRDCATNPRIMWHQDISANLAFLFGVPVPTNSLGNIIPSWIPADVPIEEVRDAQRSRIWHRCYQNLVLRDEALTDDHIKLLRDSLYGDDLPLVELPKLLKSNTPSYPYVIASLIFSIYLVIALFYLYPDGEVQYEVLLMGVEALLEILGLFYELLRWDFHVKLAVCGFVSQVALLYIYMRKNLGLTFGKVVLIQIATAVVYRGALILDPCGYWPAKIPVRPQSVDDYFVACCMTLIMIITAPRYNNRWVNVIPITIICICAVKTLDIFDEITLNLTTLCLMIVSISTSVVASSFSFKYMPKDMWHAIVLAWSISKGSGISSMLWPIGAIATMYAITSISQKSIHHKSVMVFNLAILGGVCCVIGRCMHTNNTLDSLHLPAMGAWAQKPFTMVMAPIVIRYIIPILLQKQIIAQYYVTMKPLTKPRAIEQFYSVATVLSAVRISAVLVLSEIPKNKPTFIKWWNPRLFLITYQTLASISTTVIALLGCRSSNIPLSLLPKNDDK